MADKKPTNFVTDTGRLVGGSLYEPKTTDFDGNPLVVKSGEKKGQPTQRFEFGVAFAKRAGETHFSQSTLGALIWAQGHADHPAAALRADFSWKVTDGDSQIPGKPYRGSPGVAPCTKQGYPGHWVCWFSSQRAPKIVNMDGSANITEVGAVMPGDFVQIAGSVIGNDGANAGVYLNHEVVAFQGYSPLGRLAVSGPDPATLGFGKGPQPVMTAAPVGGMTPPPPAAAAAPAPRPATPPPAPPAAPQTAVAPHPGILVPQIPAAAPPPPAAAAAPPPPPAGPQMTALAEGVPYAAFIANGWTDAMLRANGKMI